MNNIVSSMLQRAVEYYQKGQLDQAKKILSDCEKLNYVNFDVYHLLALVNFGQNNYEDANKFFKKAIKQKNDASALQNFAISLQKVGKNKEALEILKKAINIEPENAVLFYNLGNFLDEMDDIEEALNYYEKAIQLNPSIYQAFSNAAGILRKMNRHTEALDQIDKALRINPSFAKLISAKGLLLHELKLFEEASSHYDEAILLNPNDAETYFNKGNLLFEIKKFNESIINYQKAIEIKNDYYLAYSNMGNSFFHLKQYKEALINYDKALQINSSYVEAWSNKAATLTQLKQYENALIHIDRALGFNIDHPEALINKGLILDNIKNYKQAIHFISKGVALKSVDWACGELAHIKMKMCDWSGLTNLIKSINIKINLNQRVITPFALLSLIDDPLQHKKAAEIFINSKAQQNLNHELSYENHSSRISIGYFSADFREHPLSYLIAEMIELHDRNKFKVIGFSYGENDNSAIRQRLLNSFDEFIDVSTFSDQQISEFSRTKKIDIAVDLNGFSGDARISIFSNRAAPIQINWLGYPGTVGNYMDYIIADKVIIPQSHQRFYFEKIVYLPNTYIVDDSKRTISSKKFTKQELGLPEDAFIFCCFNNHYKYNQQIIDSWSKILLRVKSSVLWISYNNEDFKSNILAEFNRRGVNQNQIFFAQRIRQMDDHLARLTLADLFLDTYPYNAHSTALDSLKAGVPILTLMGQSFASRVAASILNAIDMPELITDTLEKYEESAIEIATNPERIYQIKQKLIRNRTLKPLFNTALFAQHIETAYINMYQQYQMRIGLPQED